MAFTTVSLRTSVAKRLKAAKAEGESYSDTIERLLDNQPARTVEEWIESLEPLRGRGVLTTAQRRALRRDQAAPRRSPRSRRARP